MTYLFDTSVLVAAMLSRHPMHARAFPWLDRAARREFASCAADRCVAECYAVLTMLPPPYRLAPVDAVAMIETNVRHVMTVVSASVDDHFDALHRLVNANIPGRMIYDALIAAAARRAAVDHLLTFDTDDFLRIWPEGSSVILAP